MLAILALASGSPLEFPASLPGAGTRGTWNEANHFSQPTVRAEYRVGLSETDPVMFAAA
jgi:hypothetical protein